MPKLALILTLILNISANAKDLTDKESKALKESNSNLGKFQSFIKDVIDDPKKAPEGCKIDVKKETDLFAKKGDLEARIPRFEVFFHGYGCPLEAKAVVDGKQNGVGFIANYNVEFIAKTPDLQKEYGYRSGRIGGVIDGKIEESDEGVSLVMKSKFGGNGDSLALGKHKMEINYNIKFTIDPNNPLNFSGFVNEKLSFDSVDFMAQLEREQIIKGLSGKVIAKINGKEVNNDEFETYVKDLKFPGLNKEEKPDYDLNCNLETYDSSIVSQKELEKYLQEGTKIPHSYLSQVKTSGEDEMLQLKTKTSPLFAMTKYLKDWMELEIQYFVNGQVNKKLYTIDYEFETKRVDNFGDFHFVISCEVGS